MWKYYGDIRIVQEHFPSLQRYINYWLAQVKSVGGIQNFPVGFGDWVPPPPVRKANGHLVGAFAHIRDLQLMADLATAIGNSQAATNYTNQIETYKTAFNAAFYDSSKKCYGKVLLHCALLNTEANVRAVQLACRRNKLFLFGSAMLTVPTSTSFWTTRFKTLW